MNFVIIAILLLVSFFLYRSKKTGGNEGFWSNLFATISLKVVDYFCKGSSTKIVRLFLRGLFGMYSIAALGYPTIKAFYLASDTKSFWTVLVSWDGVSTKMTCLFVIAATLVTITYLIFHRNETDITLASEEDVRDIVRNYNRSSS